MNIAFGKDEKSLALLGLFDDERRLDGLRTVQLIRSKVDAHSRGSVAADLANKALQEHEHIPAFRKRLQNRHR